MAFRKFKTWICAFAALFMTVGAFTLPAQADDPSLVLNNIRSSGILKFPVIIGEEPSYIKDPASGEWSGFYVEWGQEIAAILGVELEFVETTWGNLAADFQARKVDIAIGLNPNPQRGLVVDYTSIPLFYGPWTVVSKAGFDKKSWAELNDPSVRLAVQKGSTMQVVAEALTPKADIIVVGTRSLGVLEINSNRADAMLLASFDAVQVAPEVKGEVFVPSPALVNTAVIGVRREAGNAGWLNWLENWTSQQRSLGLAQGKLAKSFEDAGLDLSVLPGDFSF